MHHKLLKVICDGFIFLSSCYNIITKGQGVGIVIMGGHFCYMERGGQNISMHFI